MDDKTAVFDSLPYYDNDLEQYPVLREKVEKELAREPKPPQTVHPLIPPPLELFKNNPLLAAELARVEAHEPLPPLDTVRYQLPAPTSSPGTDQEWQEALHNAHAQLEHQRLRSVQELREWARLGSPDIVRHTNLALLQTYGQNAWRVSNYLLEETAKQFETTLEELRQLTTELNRERKNSQTRYGAQLTTLETRWTELLSSILQIEMANIALEGEVARLGAKEDEMVET